jgi:hypothetical protein
MATDNDGDLDLIVNNVNMEAFVLEIILKEERQPLPKIKIKGDNKKNLV